MDGNKAELLPLFLAMPLEQRSKHFADTAHTAEMFGVSQRTIQAWIECGWVNAVTVGKKHQVHLDSVREYVEKKN